MGPCGFRSPSCGFLELQLNACENVTKIFPKTTVKIMLLRPNILNTIFESCFPLSSGFKFCRLMTFNLEPDFWCWQFDYKYITVVASVTGSTNIMCSCQVTQSIVMTTQVLQSIQCLGIVMLSCRVVMKILRGEDPSLTLWVFLCCVILELMQGHQLYQKLRM